MVGIVGYCLGLESNSHPGFNGESPTTMTLGGVDVDDDDDADDDVDDGGAFSTRLSAIAN